MGTTEVFFKNRKKQLHPLHPSEQRPCKVIEVCIVSTCSTAKARTAAAIPMVTQILDF